MEVMYALLFINFKYPTAMKLLSSYYHATIKLLLCLLSSYYGATIAACGNSMESTKKSLCQVKLLVNKYRRQYTKLFVVHGIIIIQRAHNNRVIMLAWSRKVLPH